VDSNHKTIVAAIRDQLAASVQDLSSIGQGCPDILVGWRGYNFLVEIKDGDKFPAHRRLTVAEHDWHEKWAGQVIVAISAEDAINQIVHLERQAWMRERGL
jgi:hypothetical protein